MGTRATAADAAFEARDVLPLLVPLILERVPGHLLHRRAMSVCFPGLVELADSVARRWSASRRSLRTIVLAPSIYFAIQILTFASWVAVPLTQLLVTFKTLFEFTDVAQKGRGKHARPL
jgi:hypothetical protein